MPDVIAQVRDGRLEDFVRAVVVLVARELLEAEISDQVGTELGKVAPGARVTLRNGYRPRGWETRVRGDRAVDPEEALGFVVLPSFLELRRRSEQAIVVLVLVAYVNGVSTREGQSAR